MNIGANDVSNMLNKSSMVGQAQTLRVDQKVKEADKSRESEEARDANPENSTSDNGQTVGSGAGATRTGQTRRFGQDSPALQRLGRGQVEWHEQESSGGAWLPPSLRPTSRSAGNAEMGVPYWLQSQAAEQKTDSPLGSHHRLMNCLRGMVHNEIQQYVKANEPPYSKRTLREFHELLSDGTPAPVSTHGSGKRLNGEAAGYSENNWTDLQNVVSMFSNPPQPGDEFDMVA